MHGGNGAEVLDGCRLDAGRGRRDDDGKACSRRMVMSAHRALRLAEIFRAVRVAWLAGANLLSSFVPAILVQQD